MRKGKIFAVVVMLSTCIIGNSMSVSAAVPVKESNSISITMQEDDLQTNLINEEKISEYLIEILRRPRMEILSSGRLKLLMCQPCMQISRQKRRHTNQSSILKNMI